MLSDVLPARFSGQHALIAPHRSESVAACLRGLATHHLMDKMLDAQMAAATDDFWPTDPKSWMNQVRPYNVVNGVLQIPVRGVLLHDFPYQAWEWATGYKYIERAFQRGMDDPNVRGIAFIADSPGGEVAGCFDACDRIMVKKSSAATKKPVRAFAAESAYSAAFAVICCADEIVVSRTGGVGSVGVVTSHADWSGWMENYGIKITFIFAGKHKVDGNAYQPLPDDVKERIQAHIDELYGIFVTHVAKTREMSDAAVRKTEAECFSASEAVSVGFADSIGALDEELAAFSASLQQDAGALQMSNTAQTAAEQAAANEAALLAARAEARTAERARVAAIMDHAEAKTRPAAARHVALKSDMSVEAAADFLKALPEEKQEKAAGFDLNKRMDGDKQPDINASTSEDARTKDEKDADRIRRAAGWIQ